MLSIVRAPGEGDPTLGLRVMVQPLVLWLWVGGFVMAAGTALALFPGRRRNPLDPVSAPVADAPPARDATTGATPDDAPDDASTDGDPAVAEADGSDREVPA